MQFFTHLTSPAYQPAQQGRNPLGRPSLDTIVTLPMRMFHSLTTATGDMNTQDSEVSRQVTVHNLLVLFSALHDL